MCTEIASRNFADKKRYDLLPRIAETIGLTPNERADSLWKDTTLTELNRAILHSHRSRLQENYDRVRRRWKLWKRMGW